MKKINILLCASLIFAQSSLASQAPNRKRCSLTWYITAACVFFAGYFTGKDNGREEVVQNLTNRYNAQCDMFDEHYVTPGKRIRLCYPLPQEELFQEKEEHLAKKLEKIAHCADIKNWANAALARPLDKFE